MRPSTASAGSGLAVALVDVVLHQSHHLLELVLQLGPPGCGVCLQGRHNLRVKQTSSWITALGPSGFPPQILGRTPCLGFHHWQPAAKVKKSWDVNTEAETSSWVFLSRVEVSRAEMGGASHPGTYLRAIPLGIFINLCHGHIGIEFVLVFLQGQRRKELGAVVNPTIRLGPRPSQAGPGLPAARPYP